MRANVSSPPVSQVLRRAARDTGLRVAAFVCVKMKKAVDNSAFPEEGEGWQEKRARARA